MKKTSLKASYKKQFFFKEDTILHNINVKKLFLVIFLILETSHLKLLFSYYELFCTHFPLFQKRGSNGDVFSFQYNL